MKKVIFTMLALAMTAGVSAQQKYNEFGNKVHGL